MFYLTCFSFHMHINDLEILYSLKHFFGVGTVWIDKTGAHYLVTGIYSPKKTRLVYTNK
uniref:LAGLIDADG endonuclease n=1 Tax=Daedalea confragosa TaxID=2028083 RepID=UPI002A837ECE|nr:LAGLIDADG endonuclease [Daedaleopsis confragosa]WNZ34392.1 LAGLIDADG endonuclease [Daedaleopsis confragosa]